LKEFLVPQSITTASILATAMIAAACASGPSPGANVDLGSGPPKAGTVKADALKGLTLTFVSYGGIYQDGQMKAAVDPFGKESGARILQDGPTDNAKIKTQVDSGNVTWDVIDSTNVFT
jgi:putative spermidine/putrescine transport system substrate-binding protein